MTALLVGIIAVVIIGGFLLLLHELADIIDNLFK